MNTKTIEHDGITYRVIEQDHYMYYSELNDDEYEEVKQKMSQSRTIGNPLVEIDITTGKFHVVDGFHRMSESYRCGEKGESVAIVEEE
jgi:hypothetical protein